MPYKLLNTRDIPKTLQHTLAELDVNACRASVNYHAAKERFQKACKQLLIAEEKNNMAWLIWRFKGVLGERDRLLQKLEKQAEGLS